MYSLGIPLTATGARAWPFSDTPTVPSPPMTRYTSSAVKLNRIWALAPAVASCMWLVHVPLNAKSLLGMVDGAV